MTHPLKNKTFTANDIVRYNDGSMPPQERHALEKAALEDPFLADAIDGYALTQTPAADLAALRKRLAVKTDSGRKVFALPVWLRVAALVVLVGGAGLIAFQVFAPDRSGVAMDRSNREPLQETTARAVPPSDPVRDDRSKPNGSDTQQRVSLGLAQAGTPYNAADTKAYDYTFQAPDSVAKPIEPAKEGYISNTPSVTGNSRSDESPNIRSAQPDLNANMRRQNSNAFEIGKKSDAAAMNNRADKSVSDARNGDTIRNLNVVMRPLPSDAASEEVVLSTGTKPKANARKQNVTIDTLEPKGGWSQFDDYIATHLKTPEEIQLKAVTGEVQLSFEVDKEGAPINITVVKSLCDQCDEEAIRLLKAGPKWKKKKNRKGKVTIRF